MKYLLFTLLIGITNLSAAYRDVLFENYSISNIQITDNSIEFVISGNAEFIVVKPNNEPSNTSWVKYGKPTKFITLVAEKCSVKISKHENEKYTQSFEKFSKTLKSNEFKKPFIIGRASFTVSHEGFVTSIVGSGAMPSL